MKTVLVSMRPDKIDGRDEVRDSLDQRLMEFLITCGLHPVPVINSLNLAQITFRTMIPQGVVLSGGPDDPQRQAVENFLIAEAIKASLPVFGICHGLQALVSYFNGEVAPIPGHVRTRHMLVDENKNQLREVNSFHELGVASLPADWQVQARADDGSIEAAGSKSKKVGGVLWHPERERQFAEADVKLVQGHFL